MKGRNMIAICAEFKIAHSQSSTMLLMSSYQSFIIVAQFVEIIKLVILIGFKVVSRAWLMDRPGRGDVAHAIHSALVFLCSSRFQLCQCQVDFSHLGRAFLLTFSAFLFALSLVRQTHYDWLINQRTKLSERKRIINLFVFRFSPRFLWLRGKE